MQYQFILNEVAGKATLTVVIGGVPTQVDDTHPAFNEIVEGLGTLSASEIRVLLDSNRRIAKQLKQFGNVSVGDEGVTYKGEPVNGLLADRMLQMLESGLDIRPWALFLENLQKNPAKHAVDELFLWLEKSRMPITDRGNFLAYKKVKEDYTSYHPAPNNVPFRNDIGTFVDMPRNKVDDNRQRTCSQGLHFCSWDYLPSYMGSSGKVVLVEVNPAHVVSIPSDYNNAKGRAEGYMVVGEIPLEDCEHAFPNTLMVDDANPYIFHTWAATDFADVDEGWFLDDVDEDEYDRFNEETYELGYSVGFNDGYGDNCFDDEEAAWNATVDYDYIDAFGEGYADGFYEGAGILLGEQDCDEGDDPEFEIEVASPYHWTSAGVAFLIGTGVIDFTQFINEYQPDYNQIQDVLEHLDFSYDIKL